MKCIKKISFISSTFILLLTATASISASEIDKDDLIQQIQALSDNKMPDNITVDTDLPFKCGTRLMLSLISIRDEIEPVLFKQLIDRPVCDTYFDTEHFRIHYDISGPHAPFLVDVNPSNGVPDYVDSTALVFEYVWDFETDTLGYTVPVSDGIEGGDSRYDVYLSNIGGSGYFGVTVPETPQPDGRTWSSFIELENDFYEFDSYGYRDNPMMAVKVTAAHEFFHAIQFSIDAYEFPRPANRQWWYEVSSVWMEDVVFDEVNDYQYYLKYFFHYPWLSLETFSTNLIDVPRYMHAYAACVWGRYLHERFGRDVMRQIWDECGNVPNYNVFPATDLVLNNYGSSLEEAFQEFVYWNYFTADRADTINKYSEADLWINPFTNYPDTVKHIYSVPDSLSPLDYTQSDPIDLTFADSVFTPEPLAANYLVFTTYGIYNQFLGGLWLDFYGNDIDGVGDSWKLAIIGWSQERDTLIEININSLNNQGAGAFRDWSRYDSLVVIPSIFGYTYLSYGTGYSFQVYYDSNLVGDAPLFIDFPSTAEVPGGSCVDIDLHAVDPNGDSVYFYTDPPEDDTIITITHTSSETATLKYCSTEDSIGSVVSVTVFASDTAGHYDARQVNITILSSTDEPAVCAYPNPYKYDDGGVLTIRYFLPASTSTKDIELYIFDVTGNLVYKYEYGEVEFLNMGNQELTWNMVNNDSSTVAGGIYILKLRAGNKSASGKVAIIK